MDGEKKKKQQLTESNLHTKIMSRDDDWKCWPMQLGSRRLLSLTKFFLLLALFLLLRHSEEIFFF